MNGLFITGHEVSKFQFFRIEQLFNAKLEFLQEGNTKDPNVGIPCQY